MWRSGFARQVFQSFNASRTRIPKVMPALSKSLPSDEKVGKMISWFCKGEHSTAAHSVLVAREQKMHVPPTSINFFIGKLSQKRETVALEMFEDIIGEDNKHAIMPYSAVVNDSAVVIDGTSRKEDHVDFVMHSVDEEEVSNVKRFVHIDCDNDVLSNYNDDSTNLLVLPRLFHEYSNEILSCDLPLDEGMLEHDHILSPSFSSSTFASDGDIDFILFTRYLKDEYGFKHSAEYGFIVCFLSSPIISSNISKVTVSRFGLLSSLEGYHWKNNFVIKDENFSFKRLKRFKALGSVVSGGGSEPLPKDAAKDWVNMINGFQNGGLGATRDPNLAYKIGFATALEVRATGIPYVFAPRIADKGSCLSEAICWR